MGVLGSQRVDVADSFGGSCMAMAKHGSFLRRIICLYTDVAPGDHICAL